MAYETSLLPPTGHYYDSREAYQHQDNQPLVRPYMGTSADIFYEGDVYDEPQNGTYDPLTAPLQEVAEREFGSVEAYYTAPTIWDRQAEEVYQRQRAHDYAMARSVALRSMKRVAEYRANFPKDTDTLQLRIVTPKPSSVDVALAELEQLRKDIAREQAQPPMFSVAQDLHTKYNHEQTLQLRIPETIAGDTGGGAPSAPQPLGEHDGEVSASGRTRTLESELVGGSPTSKVRRKLGPIGRKASEIWRIASLSKHGASQLIDRIKQQAGF